MKFNLRWSVLLLALPLAGGLVAQEALPGAVETGNTMATEVPPGLEEKPPLSDYDLSKKKEGSYFTGLPLINSDADKGVGYGVRLYWYDNGEKSNPFFRYTPYKHRVYLQYFATTNGFQYHTLDWEAPYIGNSLWRFRTSLSYDLNTESNFFGGSVSGAGNNKLSALASDTGISDLSDKYLDITTDLRDNAGGASDETYSKYFRYKYTKPTARFTGIYDMFGGVVRPVIGFQVQHVKIETYKGKSVKVTKTGVAEKNYTQEDTLVDQMKTAGLITGVGEGLNNTILVGIAYDTRDFEPDPNNGIFAEALFEQSVASEHSWNRITVSPKFFYSPFNFDLVLAARGAVSVMGGTVPFYELDQIGYTSGNSISNGGLRSLRGFAESRFAGKAKALGNFEIRWTFAETDLIGQNFKFMLVPFVDFGSANNDIGKLSSNELKYTYGGGLRIPWNQATIIMVDYGVSEEGGGMYINFNHIF